MANSPNYGIVGYMAPEWNIPQWIDAKGKPTLIEHGALQNKIKVIFCFQSWCPGCHKLGFPALKKMVDACGQDEQIAFLAIQTVFEGFEANTFEKLRKEQKKYKLKIPFGHDPGDESTGNVSNIMYHYRTGGTPWFIVIGDDGSVLFNDFHINAEKAIEVLKELVEE